jgi:phospholipid/cholesterol/gamma-HCH transport system substrate-binding protein
MTVGLIVLVGAVIFTVMFFWLTDRGISTQRSTVHIRVPSAEKLRRGDPAVYLGVQVGEVRHVDFAEGGGVVVRVRLKRPIQLKADATAEIGGNDVLGSMRVVLHPGSSDAPLLSDNGTIEGAIEGSFTNRIGEIAGKGADLLDDYSLSHGPLRTSIDVATGTAQDIQRAAVAMTGLMADQGVAAGGAIARLEKLLVTLDQEAAAADVSGFVAELRAATEDLRLAARSAAVSGAHAETILDAVASGKGSAGAFIMEREFYDESLLTVRSVRGLVEDVRANPGRYISLRLFR